MIAGGFEIVPDVPPVEPLVRNCLPGTLRCSGQSLEVCADDRRSFQLVEDCGSREACDPTAGACHPCVPGEYACNVVELEDEADPEIKHLRSELVQCDENLQWQLRDTCLTPELCSLTNERRTGVCLGATCEENEHSCSTNRLIRCAPGRDRWELLEVCSAQDHCDSVMANAAIEAGERAHCLPNCEGEDCGTECEPGTWRCASPTQVQQCNADGYWVQREVCDSRALCDEEGGRCMSPACDWDNPKAEEPVPDRRCMGQERQACASNNLKFVRIDACNSGEQCTPDGCIVDPCTEGDFRCNDRTLERCEGGRWDPRQICRTPELCNDVAKRCQDPECAPGSHTCDRAWVNLCPNGIQEYHSYSCEPEICVEYTDPTHDVLNCIAP